MSEFDAETNAPTPDVTRPPHRLRSRPEVDDEDPSEPEPPAREGLPPSYRMRADRHYIDHMSDSVGVPVRLIPVERLSQEEPAEPTPAALIDALTKSIAAHGVLQPLLITKRDDGYRVISGRKRLAAAMAAGLKAVPCLVHDVGEAEAAALTEAGNLGGGSPQASAARALPFNMADLMQELQSDLLRLERSIALLRNSSGGSVYQRTAVDLVAAQAWRSSWLAGATGFLLGGPQQSRRPRSLHSIVERVVQGFEPELRLAGGQVRSVVASGSSVMVDERLGELMVSSAVVCTLFVLQTVEQPLVDLRISVADDVVTVESAQQAVETLWDLEQVFAESAPIGRGQLVVGLAAKVLSAIASQHHGTVNVIAEGRRGSGVRCTLQV